jgi:hypothetical protein
MFTDSQINKARQTIREQTDLFDACHHKPPKDPINLERFMNNHNWFWNGSWWIKDCSLWAVDTYSNNGK